MCLKSDGGVIWSPILGLHWFYGNWQRNFPYFHFDYLIEWKNQ